MWVFYCQKKASCKKISLFKGTILCWLCYNWSHWLITNTHFFPLYVYYDYSLTKYFIASTNFTCRFWQLFCSFSVSTTSACLVLKKCCPDGLLELYDMARFFLFAITPSQFIVFFLLSPLTASYSFSFSHFLSSHQSIFSPSKSHLSQLCFFSFTLSTHSGLTPQWLHLCLRTSTYSCPLGFLLRTSTAWVSMSIKDIAMTWNGELGPFLPEMLSLMG